MRGKTIFVSDYAATIKAGISTGSLSDYRPGLTVQHSKSQATSTRLWSPKLKRMVHLLSHGEKQAFLQFEFDPDVVDIWDQYLLDPKQTQEICKELNLIHPQVYGNPVVMSSDFVVTRSVNGLKKQVVYQVKDTPSALTPRVKAKLKVEYLFWQRQNIPWSVIYSSEFNQTYCNNLEWLHCWQGYKLTDRDLAKLHCVVSLVQELFSNLKVARLPHQPIDISGNRILSLQDVIMCLCANHHLSFPIREVNLFHCPVSEFHV